MTKFPNFQQKATTFLMKLALMHFNPFCIAILGTSQKKKKKTREQNSSLDEVKLIDLNFSRIETISL